MGAANDSVILVKEYLPLVKTTKSSSQEIIIPDSYWWVTL